MRLFPDSEEPEKTPRKIKLILVFFSILVGIVVSEVILDHTIFGYQKSIRPNSDDPRLSYTLLPDRNAVWRTSDGKEYHVTINRWGLRGPDLALSKPVGIKRIALVGDSMVFGAGLEQEDTIAYRLQSLLDSEFGEAKYQVLNAGVPGYNTLQESFFILERIIPLDPDIIVWVYYINDLEELDYQPEIVEQCGISYSNWEWLDSKFRRYSKLYRFLVHGSDTSFNEYEKADPYGLPRRCFRASIARVAEEVSGRGIRVFLVFMPYLSWPDRNPSAPPDWSVHVKAAAAKHGFGYIDLRETFNGYRAEDLYLSDRDKHPNPRATDLIARRLERLLRNPDKTM